MEFEIYHELGKIILENRNKLFKIKNTFKFIKIKKKLHTLKKYIDARISSENFRKDYYMENDEKNHAYENSSVSNKFLLSCKHSFKRSKTVNCSYNKNPYYNILDELKRSCLELMSFLSVNIIFDDLDELATNLDNNEDLIMFLNKFLENTKKVNMEMRDHDIKNSRVIVLLRTDILDVLNNHSSNLNKMLSDSEIRLDWIKKKHSGDIHPLMDLILSKIKNSNDKLKECHNQDIMDIFFTKKIDSKDTINYMLDNSFGRPRDLVNMLNIIIENYGDRTKFKEEFFLNTRLEYSRNFLGELKNELCMHYDSQVIEEFITLSGFLPNKTFYERQMQNTIDKHKNELTYFTDAKKYIDFAYKYGIIGNISQVNGPSGSVINKYSSSYREDGLKKPNYSMKFFVHLALRKCLLN